MGKPAYCKDCGNSLQWTEEGKPCPQCGATASAGHPLQETLDEAVAAVQQQSGYAASMLSALAAAQMLPLGGLLQDWWDRLDDGDRNAISKALASRCVTLAGQGALDDQLEAVAMAAMTEEALRSHVDALLADTDDHRLGHTIVERLSYQLNNDLKHEVQEGLRSAVYDIAKRAAEKESERITAELQQRLPEIDELAREIAQDQADCAARTAKATLKKLTKGKS